MKSQINKWGNSAAIRIPANMLAALGLSVHSAVSIEAKDGQIIIQPIDSTQKRLKLPFTEASLLGELDRHTSHADQVAMPLAAELEN